MVLFNKDDNIYSLESKLIINIGWEHENLGLLEFTPEGLRVKFKLCRNKDLGCLRHHLVIGRILIG
ncbi:hypothetical protein LCGC14_1627810, partial [marine sediment metagenome]